MCKREKRYQRDYDPGGMNAMESFTMIVVVCAIIAIAILA